MNTAVFLDRDGIINVDSGYVHNISDLKFCENIFQILRYFQSLEYILIIITNQSGIGRGYFSEDDFTKFMNHMLLELKKRNIRIDKIYYCPFHPTEGLGYYRKVSFNRKPNPGMILKAKVDFDIDLEKSILIGDKLVDIEAGINAGIKYKYLVNNFSEVNYNCIQVSDLLDIIKIHRELNM